MILQVRLTLLSSLASSSRLSLRRATFSFVGNCQVNTISIHDIVFEERDYMIRLNSRFEFISRLSLTLSTGKSQA